MKRMLFCLILFFSFYTLCFSQTKELQYRLVLTEQESETTPFDRYIDKFNKEILVSKIVLLSNKDIEKIGMGSNEFGEPLLIIEFTPEGKDKLFEFTGKYVNRQLAVIVGNEVLLDPYIREAIDTGWTAVFASSLSNAEELIKSLGFAPYLQYGIKSDDEAIKSYQFVKYAMEISRPIIAEEIIRQFYKYNPKSDFIQKLINEYPSLSKVKD